MLATCPIGYCSLNTTHVSQKQLNLLVHGYIRESGELLNQSLDKKGLLSFIAIIIGKRREGKIFDNIVDGYKISCPSCTQLTLRAELLPFALIMKCCDPTCAFSSIRIADQFNNGVFREDEFRVVLLAHNGPALSTMNFWHSIGFDAAQWDINVTFTLVIEPSALSKINVEDFDKIVVANTGRGDNKGITAIQHAFAVMNIEQVYPRLIKLAQGTEIPIQRIHTTHKFFEEQQSVNSLWGAAGCMTYAWSGRDKLFRTIFTQRVQQTIQPIGLNIRNLWTHDFSTLLSGVAAGVIATMDLTFGDNQNHTKRVLAKPNGRGKWRGPYAFWGLDEYLFINILLRAFTFTLYVPHDPEKSICGFKPIPFHVYELKTKNAVQQILTEVHAKDTLYLRKIGPDLTYHDLREIVYEHITNSDEFEWDCWILLPREKWIDKCTAGGYNLNNVAWDDPVPMPVFPFFLLREFADEEL